MCKRLLIFILLLFVAYSFTILPLSSRYVAMQPLWVFLALNFILPVVSRNLLLLMGFIAGLLLDVLQGTLLGEQAFAMTLALYGAWYLRVQEGWHSRGMEVIAIMVLSWVYLLVVFCVQALMGEIPSSIDYWVAALTSGGVWLLIARLGR